MSPSVRPRSTVAPAPPAASPTMSVEDAAKLLRIGINQAYSAVKRGDIPAIRLGKRILVLRVPLERMLAGPAAT